MFTKHRQYRNVLGIMILFLVISAIVAVIGSFPNAITTNNTPFEKITQVIIDPGHGGIDPGAIGVDSITEKDINLAIGLCLKDILIVNGYEVIMTRETDISIHDESATTIKQIKTSDLKKRLHIMEEHPDAIVISIHQNHYTSQSSSGAQMFYGVKNEDSEKLAQSMQTAFVENLQPDNNRQIKKSTSAVYVVHNAINPIVMVECGFISNNKEGHLLINEEYQQQIAFSIFSGIVNSTRAEG